MIIPFLTTVALAGVRWKHQRSPHDILNVKRTASTAEIKKAFHEKYLPLHRMASDYAYRGLEIDHDSMRDIVLLQDAYKILFDPESRNEYEAQFGESRHDSIRNDPTDSNEGQNTRRYSQVPYEEWYPKWVKEHEEDIRAYTEAVESKRAKAIQSAYDAGMDFEIEIRSGT